VREEAGTGSRWDYPHYPHYPQISNLRLNPLSEVCVPESDRGLPSLYWAPPDVKFTEQNRTERARGAQVRYVAVVA
jgi:hypothetical protein